MSHIHDWHAAILAAVALAITVYFIVALTCSAIKSDAERRAAVARLLAKPEQIQRVWFVQREYNNHHEVLLYARDEAGQQLTLAFPSEAPKVWHLLQCAGIMVHAEP